MNIDQPDPWATVDEILAQCTRRHDGGQSVQPSVYSMSISTAKALRQAIDYARAEVERRNAEETERLKALAEAWREAYEGTEHAALYEEWQHEREAQREALDALKATHEATLAAVGRSHAQALEKLKAEIARLEAEAASFHMSYRIKADADSKAALIRAEQAESERDTLRAQLAAVQEAHSELASIAGSALVLATLDTVAGERPATDPDHALTDAVWRLVRKRDAAYVALQSVRACIMALTPRHRTGYDWNADPLYLTRKVGEALSSIDDANV